MGWFEFALFAILGWCEFGGPASQPGRMVLMILFILLMLLWLIFGMGAFSGGPSFLHR